MQKALRSILLVALASLMMFAGAAVIAQEEVPGPGEGGVIVWGNQRGSANIGPLVPIRCSGVDCADVNNRLYPSFIGLDPATLSLQPGMANSLVIGWEPSEDGSQYTFFLRDDMTWSDGTPITAYDVYFTWAAIQAGDQIGLSSSYGPARADIVDAEVVDETTITLTFSAANCLALNRAALLPPLPGHAYGWEFGEDFDFTILNGHPFDREPEVTAGVFQFSRIEAGTAIYLEADQNYADPIEGYVVPSGMVYLDVPDYNVMAERLLAGQPGDINFMFEPDTGVLPTLEEGGAQVFNAPGTIWHYVALNLADPTNPQPGLDEDGNPIDQGFHPIFGDVRVRQALQYATDIEAIIEGAQNGNATAMVSGTIPSAFTIHPSLERRAFDLDAARALLDEAGWVSTGDPIRAGGDGLRTCQGCLHAEEGTALRFEVMNIGDSRNDVAIIMQDTFAQIGVDMEVAVLDFNTMYDGRMGTQTFDAAIAGWRGGIPFNADQRNFFGAAVDIPGDGSGEYGFNFGSWYNAEFEELAEYVFAGAVADGCDEDLIKEAAWRMQEIMWDDQPYIWLYALNSAYVASPSIANFAPYPAQGVWNIDSWFVRE